MGVGLIGVYPALEETGTAVSVRCGPGDGLEVRYRRPDLASCYSLFCEELFNLQSSFMIADPPLRIGLQFLPGDSVVAGEGGQKAQGLVIMEPEITGHGGGLGNRGTGEVING